MSDTSGSADTADQRGTMVMSDEPVDPRTKPELPRGRMALRVVAGSFGGKVYVHLPRAWRPGGAVLVVVHGISRNARELVRLFAPRAERAGFAIVAPLFSRDRYRDYQRLGLEKGGRRADEFLNAALDAFGRWTGAPVRDVRLFGFSGGAQFAHRYAMIHPGRVRALVLGAAGWYTMPDESQPFPLGLAAAPVPALVEQRTWLELPILVLVGSRDTERDDALRQTPYLDVAQGRNRVERGRRFAIDMRAAAARYGLTSRVEFALLPGVGHDFAECMTTGGMADQALPFLGLDDRSIPGDSA